MKCDDSPTGLIELVGVGGSNGTPTGTGNTKQSGDAIYVPLSNKGSTLAKFSSNDEIQGL